MRWVSSSKPGSQTSRALERPRLRGCPLLFEASDEPLRVDEVQVVTEAVPRFDLSRWDDGAKPVAIAIAGVGAVEGYVGG